MQIRLTQLLSNTNVTGTDVMVTDVSGPFGYITKQTTVDNLAKYITSSINVLQLNSLSASYVSSSLIPALHEVYDLGTPTNSWRDLYLSGTTIYLGAKKLSVEDNQLKIDNQIVVTAATGGNTQISGNMSVEQVTVTNFETKTISTNVFKITGSYDFNLDPDKHVILVNAFSGEVTASIPLASAVPSRQYIFKKTDSTANAVHVYTAYDTIDGVTSKELLAQYETLTIISDGTGSWFVL